MGRPKKVMQVDFSDVKDKIEGLEQSEAVINGITYKKISIPLKSNLEPEVYCQRQIYIQGLKREEAFALKRLTRALEDMGARLKTNHPVDNAQRAIRWLLEQLI